MIFNEYGPLGSFASRFKLAYLLGIITEDSYMQCKAIQKIRNAFAHNPESLTFSCPELMKHAKAFELKSTLELHKFSNRSSFIVAVNVLLEIIEQRIEELKPLVLNNLYQTALEVEQIINQAILEMEDRDD